jgi:8-oxo-dGTP pyrophosphatase MutT (NUDIX family)
MERDLPEGVVAVVRRIDGAYLLVQRATHNSFGGYWCPVSGRVEPGESHAQTAEREAREEVGIEIRALRKLHVQVSASGAYMLHWWLCEHVSGEPSVMQPDEVADVCWVDIAGARRLLPHFQVDIDLMLRLERELGAPPGSGETDP